MKDAKQIIIDENSKFLYIHLLNIAGGLLDRLNIIKSLVLWAYMLKRILIIDKFSMDPKHNFMIHKDYRLSDYFDLDNSILYIRRDNREFDIPVSNIWSENIDTLPHFSNWQKKNSLCEYINKQQNILHKKYIGNDISLLSNEDNEKYKIITICFNEHSNAQQKQKFLQRYQVQGLNQHVSNIFRPININRGITWAPSKQVRELGEKVVSDLGENFTVLHIRRGDTVQHDGTLNIFTIWKYKLLTSPYNILRILRETYQKGKPLYIMTNEKNTAMHDRIVKEFQAYFYTDFEILRSLIHKKDETQIDNYKLFAIELFILSRANIHIFTRNSIRTKTQLHSKYENRIFPRNGDIKQKTFYLYKSYRRFYPSIYTILYMILDHLSRLLRSGHY